MKSILLLFLKLYDFISRPFSKKSDTKVIFHHPDHPHLMKEVYTQKKEIPSGSFFVEAVPYSNDWNEYIKLGNNWLHNYYHLDVEENGWKGSPTGRTFTKAVVAYFSLDFSKKEQTLLNLHAKPGVTDASQFQSWFEYCKSKGVQEIEIVKE